MNSQQELVRALEAAFRDEASTMDLDVVAAAARLDREVTAAERARHRTRVLAVVAAALLVGGSAILTRTSSTPGAEEVPAGPGPAPASSPVRAPVADGSPYVLDLDTGRVSTLSSDVLPEVRTNSVSYELSPDGEWIAYAARVLEPTGGSGAEAALIRLDGSDRRVLPVTRSQGVGAVVWSPDGRHVAYQVTDGTPRAIGQIHVYDLSTGDSRPVTHLTLSAADMYSLSYNFSADSTSLLYDLPRSAHRTTWDVWSVPLGGGRATRVIEDARAPDPLPDGSGIAYVEPTVGSFSGAAVRIRETTGADRVVVDGVVGIGWVVVAPDASKIAYTDNGVIVVDLSSGTSVEVSDDDLQGWADDHTLVLSHSR